MVVMHLLFSCLCSHFEIQSKNSKDEQSNFFHKKGYIWPECDLEHYNLNWSIYKQRYIFVYDQERFEAP